MEAKKIAFLVAGINAGGTENYLLRFIKYYKGEFDVTVYCKSGRLGELEKEYKEQGVRIIPYYLGYFNYLGYFKFKKELKKEEYTTVCDLTGSFGAFPLLMAKRAGILKRIAFYRNSREKFKKTYFKVKYNNFITALLPKVATKVLSNSKNALDYFYPTKEWVFDNKFKVIYNGIEAKKFVNINKDLKKELLIPEKAFVVGHVGRLNEQKNHATIIKVAIELCKNYGDVYFILCGKNVDTKYQEIIETHEFQNRIKLLGVRRDINKVLKTLDCFYFPSLVEGQPNALIEALIIGLPFVASNIEPIKETIPENYHKQLVLPTDIDSAIEKILEIKNNSEIRNTLNISEWAIDYFNPEKWFSLVHKEL